MNDIVITAADREAIRSNMQKSWDECLAATHEQKRLHRSADPLGAEAIAAHHRREAAIKSYSDKQLLLRLIGIIVSERGHKVVLTECLAPEKPYSINWVDNKGDKMVLHRFDTDAQCRAWLMEGIYGCEGAERDHYVNMLRDFEAGVHDLNY